MSTIAQNHLAGASKEIEPPNKLRAECVIIGNATSPKVEIELEPSGHNSFTGLGSFNIGGDKFFIKVVLMPEKVGNVFARRENGHVVYQKGSVRGYQPVDGFIGLPQPPKGGTGESR